MNARDKHTRDVPLYLDNELRGQELQDFLAHLAGCPVCTIQLAEERAFLARLHRSRPLYTAPDQLLARCQMANLRIDRSEQDW
jgi:putative zinc finger protein